MRPEDRDKKYLWDMCEACRDIIEFLADEDLNQFIADKRLRSAVERKLEIIGEAAKRLSAGFVAAHPEIPWRSIIGMRNLLAHDYGVVMVDRVFLAASEKVGELLRQLEQIFQDKNT